MANRRWQFILFAGLTGLTFLAACGGPSPSAVAPTAAATLAAAATALGIQPSPTAGAVPTTALSAAEFQWSVDIVQNSQPLVAVNDQVQPQRSAFTIRVRMPQPLPVKLNALNSDANFQALQPGYILSEDCTLALCTGMDVAEERLNPQRDLFVDPQLTHYLYYQGPQDHRWSRVDLTAQGAVLDRDVASLNGKPVAQYQDAALYLLLFVNYTNPGQIDPGELKKITLVFK
jgi:hypothetical protein